MKDEKLRMVLDITRSRKKEQSWVLLGDRIYIAGRDIV